MVNPTGHSDNTTNLPLTQEGLPSQEGEPSDEVLAKLEAILNQKQAERVQTSAECVQTSADRQFQTGIKTAENEKIRQEKSLLSGVTKQLKALSPLLVKIGARNTAAIQGRYELKKNENGTYDPVSSPNGHFILYQEEGQPDVLYVSPNAPREQLEALKSGKKLNINGTPCSILIKEVSDEEFSALSNAFRLTQLFQTLQKQLEKYQEEQKAKAREEQRDEDRKAAILKMLRQPTTIHSKRNVEGTETVETEQLRKKRESEKEWLAERSEQKKERRASVIKTREADVKEEIRKAHIERKI